LLLGLARVVVCFPAPHLPGVLSAAGYDRLYSQGALSTNTLNDAKKELPSACMRQVTPSRSNLAVPGLSLIEKPFSKARSADTSSKAATAASTTPRLSQVSEDLCTHTQIDRSYFSVVAQRANRRRASAVRTSSLPRRRQPKRRRRRSQPRPSRSRRPPRTSRIGIHPQHQHRCFALHPWLPGRRKRCDFFAAVAHRGVNPDFTTAGHGMASPPSAQYHFSAIKQPGCVWLNASTDPIYSRRGPIRSARDHQES
jgi:hypothetical protein